jgi:hypothetical protein
MKTNWMRAVATACGLGLVLAAFSGTARAIDIAPEIDPGSMTSALALLTGGMLMLTGRRRRA